MNNQVKTKNKKETARKQLKPGSSGRRTVRKTLTIDGDLADFIDAKTAEEKKNNLREKDVVNKLIRLGITAYSSEREKKPYRVPRFNAKLAPGMTRERLEELLDEI